MANSKTRRYGLVGAGMMGREHIRSLALVEGADLVAIAEPDANSVRAAQETLARLPFEATVHRDWKSMIEAERLDAVIVATPNHTHFAIVDGLMDTQIALLIEKPLCTNLADARRIAERARHRNALTHVGLEYRYMPPVRRFLEQLHAGAVGTPHMLMIREHRFAFLKKVGDWNRFNENTGGTLVEKCCHFFDLMRVALRDEPVRIYASAGQDVNHLDERYHGRVPDLLDNAFVTVDFANGARACLDLCMFAEGSEQQEDISVIGEKAKLEVQIPSGAVTLSPRDRSGIVRELVQVDGDILAAGDHHGATVFHLRAFHAALVSGGAAPVSAFDGLRSVEMGVAAQQSALTGMACDISVATPALA